MLVVGGRVTASGGEGAELGIGGTDLVAEFRAPLVQQVCEFGEMSGIHHSMMRLGFEKHTAPGLPEPAGSCYPRGMAITLNASALTHARSLVKDGKVVKDERDDWSEAAPSTDQENDFIEKHGYAEYAKWHLGVDKDKPEDTKGRYSFPYGDFAKVRRGGVISAESRAAQNDHDDIATATRNLLELIDE